MHSNAGTVEQYLAELPEERRRAVETVRKVILENLPSDYEEAMNWGMISYQVPLSIFPDTYNKQPLMYAALASQKNYVSLYLTAVYMDEKSREEFEKEFRTTGKNPDMGKSCIRFKKLEDLPLPLVAKVVASYDVKAFIRKFQEIMRSRKEHRKGKR